MYSIKFPLVATTASKQLRNPQHLFWLISMFKLLNAAMIFPFSSSLVLEDVYWSLAELSPTQNNKVGLSLGCSLAICNGDVVAQILRQVSLGFLAF